MMERVNSSLVEESKEADIYRLRDINHHVY